MGVCTLMFLLAVGRGVTGVCTTLLEMCTCLIALITCLGRWFLFSSTWASLIRPSPGRRLSQIAQDHVISLQASLLVKCMHTYSYTAVWTSGPCCLSCFAYWRCFKGHASQTLSSPSFRPNQLACVQRAWWGGPVWCLAGGLSGTGG